MNAWSVGYLLLALLLAPLPLGVIAKTKALFAGRVGPPLWQGYADLVKLWRKGAVYSRTTTWVFRLGPVVGVTAAFSALLLTPHGPTPACLTFNGDLILFAYWLGLMRFFTILAALDTGSSFEGMGAAREAFFAALAEPTLLLGWLALAHETGSFGGLSLSGLMRLLDGAMWLSGGPALILIAGAWMVLLLAENARIPVDDPQTHLELTMIHEVMVLDHGGPDLALILYGAALKWWMFSALLVGLVCPARPSNPWLGGLVFLGGMAAVAVGVGVVESVMARLRLVRVPHLLMAAAALTVFSLILVFR